MKTQNSIISKVIRQMIFDIHLKILTKKEVIELSREKFTTKQASRGFAALSRKKMITEIFFEDGEPFIEISDKSLKLEEIVNICCGKKKYNL